MSALSYDYDLICVGSGPAGQRAAVQAAKLGKRVAIVEKRRVVGGVCLETGTIPSKTFREAVRGLLGAMSFDDGLGFAPKTKPAMQTLVKRVALVIERETQVLQDQLQRNDVNVILGRAELEGPRQLRVETDSGSRSLRTRFILIGVGTEAVQPKGVDPNATPVIVSDGVVNMESLPRTMAVVGAGVIGIEYASMFAALGVETTVIDTRLRPLEFLDRELVDELIHQLRSQNVTFRLGETVSELEIIKAEGAESGLIRLESGKRLIANMVLFSVGRVGATAALNLPAAGLVADARGRLKVDNNYCTEVESIYAAGDIIGFPSLAATSSEQGRLAACHMFGADCRTMPDYFPVGIYAIPEVSMVGKTEEQLTADKVPYETGIARYREIARGQILGDDSGLFKMLFHRDSGKLLGVHIVGTGATELIHTGQAVLALGGGLDYFLGTVFNYPTLAECYKVAALDAANKLAQFRRLCEG